MQTQECRQDIQVSISLGKSRKETKWKNKLMLWSQVVDKLKTVTRTRETHNQYQKMTKDEKAIIKDVGGFVGGVVKNGRRKAGSVAWRSLLTLDADFVDSDFLQRLEFLFGNTMAIYSTHSHHPDAPKLRLVAPFKRQVTADEYEAISRFVAADIGIDMFDDTTYQPERLMYWPSASEDAEYLFKEYGGPLIDPDEILRVHPNWKDASTWPESSRSHERRIKSAEKQGDPRDKPGTIGAFCRVYTVSDVMDNFLQDIYAPCEAANRYTYVNGSTSAGVVVYNSDLFSYSHHGTDAAGGVLCNAFDLVRIHKFGLKDEDVPSDTPINKLPSYRAMIDWAIQNEAVRIELANTNSAAARQEFGDGVVSQDNNNWKSQLAYNDKGNLQQSIHNNLLILRHDEFLKDAIAFNELTRNINVLKKLPWQNSGYWTDEDDAALRHYLEILYGLKRREDMTDAVKIITKENTYHPIRQYLDSLVWDGRERIETLLIDFLGCEDSIYCREISKKWLTAGAARIKEPGIKFDNMLILVGKQGIGKSTFFSKLAKNPDWFSDSMTKFDNSKDSMEQLAGKWIIELGELSALKKYEVEHVKVFLSKQMDSYRKSYGRHTSNYKRECVFAGTTNRTDFLHDVTGARRFWPIEGKDTTNMFRHMTPEVVDQIWAEAYVNYYMGEKLYLSKQASKESVEHHNIYTETGGKPGVAEEFLERLLPESWEDMGINDKVAWLNGQSLNNQSLNGVKKRECISGIELFVECFNGRADAYTKKDAFEMSDILNSIRWNRGGTRRIKEYGKQRVYARY